MIDKNRLVPYLVCSTLFAVLVGAAGAQAQKSHDALARARLAAKAQSQRVLLVLQGERTEQSDALEAALHDYRNLGKLLRYEYQLAAQPANSLAGRDLRQTLELDEALVLPALFVLDADDRVVATLQASDMGDAGAIDTDRLRRFLEAHKTVAVDARETLEQGLALARKSQRKTFVYLSAPW